MFVENLVQVLQERNITAYKLSKDTGIHQSTISQWKSGLQKPSLEAAEKVADYLDCSVDYLLGRTDRPEINKQMECDSMDDKELRFQYETGEIPRDGTYVCMNCTGNDPETVIIPAIGRELPECPRCGHTTWYKV